MLLRTKKANFEKQRASLVQTQALLARIQTLIAQDKGVLVATRASIHADAKKLMQKIKHFYKALAKDDAQPSSYSLQHVSTSPTSFGSQESHDAISAAAASVVARLQPAGINIPPTLDQNIPNAGYAPALVPTYAPALVPAYGEFQPGFPGQSDAVQPSSLELNPSAVAPLTNPVVNPSVNPLTPFHFRQKRDRTNKHHSNSVHNQQVTDKTTLGTSHETIQKNEELSSQQQSKQGADNEGSKESNHESSEQINQKTIHRSSDKTSDDSGEDGEHNKLKSVALELKSVQSSTLESAKKQKPVSGPGIINDVGQGTDVLRKSFHSIRLPVAGRQPRRLH